MELDFKKIKLACDDFWQQEKTSICFFSCCKSWEGISGQIIFIRADFVANLMIEAKYYSCFLCQ